MGTKDYYLEKLRTIRQRQLTALRGDCQSFGASDRAAEWHARPVPKNAGTKMTSIRALSLFGLVVFPVLALGDGMHFKGGRCAQPPVIDGVIDEAHEWKDAIYFDKFVDQSTNQPAEEETQFWMEYDDKCIYFAARAFEPASEIRAQEYRVNADLSNDDSVALYLDLVGTLSELSSFSVNARGATSLYIAGGHANKREWSGEFKARGRITPCGYEVEAAIPWSILPVTAPGTRTLRFLAARGHIVTQRGDVMAFTNDNKVANTPYWDGVEVPAPPLKHTIKLLPYLYGGYETQLGQIVDAGVDARTSLTKSVQAVASVEPDFRNIAGQILSLDFSRLPRLTGEVRPFFLEGADDFNTDVFTSQLIPRFDVGFKTYGKLSDKSNFGLLDTDWFGQQQDVVFNWTQNMQLNEQARFSYTRQDVPGNENQAYMARYTRAFGPWSIFFREEASFDGLQGVGKDHYASLSWSKTPFFVNVDETWRQSTYAPALSFVPENNLQGPTVFANYFKQPSKGPWQQVYAQVYTADYDHIDGGFYRNDRSFYINANNRPTKLYFETTLDWPDYEGQHDHTVEAAVHYPYNDPHRYLSTGFVTGTEALLPYNVINFGGAYRACRNRLDVGLTGQLVNYQGYNDQIILTANYDMGKDRAISGRVVEQSGQVGGYLAYQLTGNRGPEYFLVLGDPNSPTFKTALIFKVTVPVEF
jgi:hypothetical protein